MKKIISLIVVLFILLSTLYISVQFKNDKIYYLSLGDSLAAGRDSYGKYGHGYSDYISEYLEERGILEKYIRKFAKAGYEVEDLIEDINNNREITIDKEKITIQNALVKADLITLSIGSNNVMNAYKYDEDIDLAIENALDKMEELFELLRLYSKEKIVVTSYYNPFYINLNWSSKVKKGNIKLEELAKKYGIIYVDIYDVFLDSTYLPVPTDPHPSNEGYKKISEIIIDRIGGEL